ncbi:histidinol-phosphate transaminase [Gloeocapsopsis dulcis]|uniref:Histidinol-phosphate aminotransferase n=1 Tax=Gloeocapsopsis dulcis AAB1 = 1H9 TaxID=1433147 RepID=A0A6N8FVP4_9CHRO|nr:histidinol-phosphate transaminase [Gloeocapsopsis dulcis]MUL36395.1 histidinol-phosphate transaminase [Gloeocapsopsis dulcis AAB1 = 1H9]WNN88110.1 histidinol-phosphate transaminase [Gloeocapsopsis dulcis]
MLPFIRSDLAQLTAYTPHPNSTDGKPIESVIDRLDTNESPFDLPSELKQKLALVYQETIETNRYPDGGHATLKEAIAEYVNESANLTQGAIAPNQISVGNGSDELIRSLLIATCLRGEGSILVANPTFSMYGILAQTLGIPVVTVGRTSEFEIDSVAAQTAIETTRTPPIRVVFVVHPNSPTGNALTTAEIAWLRSLPQDILVVIDEAYFEFSQTSVVGELSQKPNWVVLRTFSKAFRLAALRVGYAIASPEITTVLEKVRLPYNLPSFSQAAAILALQQRHLLLQLIALICEERTKLTQALTQYSVLKVNESAANFIYIQTSHQAQHSELLPKLAQQLRCSGTIIRSLNGGLRITVGSPAENLRTLERLQVAFVKWNER